MRNHECEIRFVLESGWTQTVRKRGVDGPWVQTTNGVERTMTAEQLLSHLLPALTEDNLGRPRVRVVVVPDPRPSAGAGP